MSNKTLEDVLAAAGNPVDMLRNSQVGAYIYPTERRATLAAREAPGSTDRRVRSFDAVLQGDAETVFFDF